MPPAAALSGAPWRVTPGESAEVSVMVRNAGATVDRFTIDVVGAPGAWATVEPAVLPLLPGTAAEVVVRFEPPRSGVARGPTPFGVRVVSETDESSVVEEGVLEVTALAALGAELRPRTSEGRSGNHLIHVLNQGNTPVQATVTVDDPDEQLMFRLDRHSVEVRPGESAAVELGVAARRRTGGHRRFQVRVDADGSAPVLLEGALSVPALRPRLWPKLTLAAAVLAVVALIASQVMRPNDGGDVVTTRPVRLQHTFATSEAEGVRADRAWRYAVDGRLLENELTVSNTSPEPRTAVVFEVIPKEVAAHVSAVRFDPAPAEVVEDDPVVRFDVPLDAGGSATLRWEANLATSVGATGLSALASKRDAAELAFHAARQPLVDAADAGGESTAVVPPQGTTTTARPVGGSGGATRTTIKPPGGSPIIDPPPPGGGDPEPPDPPPPVSVSAPGEVTSALVKDPTAAREVNGVPEEVRVTLEWGAPSSDGGEAPAAYRIRCTLMQGEDTVYAGGGSPAPCKGGAVVATASGSVHSTTVVTERVEPGPGTWLKWDVAAENSAGVGPYRTAAVVVPNLVGLYSWQAFPYGRAVGLRTHGGAPYDCGQETYRICRQSHGVSESHAAGVQFTVWEEKG